MTVTPKRSTKGVGRRSTKGVDTASIIHLFSEAESAGAISILNPVFNLYQPYPVLLATRVPTVTFAGSGLEFWLRYWMNYGYSSQYLGVQPIGVDWTPDISDVWTDHWPAAMSPSASQLLQLLGGSTTGTNPYDLSVTSQVRDDVCPPYVPYDHYGFVATPNGGAAGLLAIMFDFGSSPWTIPAKGNDLPPPWYYRVEFSFTLRITL